jgi:tetratricopeptide (TPR) repeat protein
MFGAILAAVVPVTSASTLLAAESAPAASHERIAQLIKQLGADDYFSRERAQEELARLGIEAFDALTAAENDKDVEIADRARYLVRLLRVRWFLDTDPPEVKRALETYEILNEEDRQAKLKELSDMPDDKGLTALARLVRFEKSQVLSKQAALAIVKQRVRPETDFKDRKTAILAGIGESPRPAAGWLRTYITAHDDLAAGAEAWGRWVDAEVKTIREFPDLSNDEIAIGLYQQQFAALKKLNRTADADACAMRMLLLDFNQDGDSQTLGELLWWLVDQKAWPALEEAPKRFAARLSENPLLIYPLARSAEAQGQKELAEKRLEQARGLNPGHSALHRLVAEYLKRKGEISWAEQEYRLAITMGQAGQQDALWAQHNLAEMLHDHDQDEGAAKVMEQAVTALEAQANIGQQGEAVSGFLAISRARMHFFFACHEAQQKNREKQIERLWKCLKQDPSDADGLIALYRIGDLEAKQKEEVRKLIHAAADKFRDAIREKPDNPTNYNQFAWLVANTEGNKDEALNCSQKSLELSPNEAGYMDTLARCYYAKGEYEKAVKMQTQAIEIDPHSGQMNRQLAFFREELAKHKK